MLDKGIQCQQFKMLKKEQEKWRKNKKDKKKIYKKKLAKMFLSKVDFELLFNIIIKLEIMPINLKHYQIDWQQYFLFLDLVYPVFNFLKDY